MKKWALIVAGLYCLWGNEVMAQSGNDNDPIPEYKVPINRQLAHDNINNEQKRLLASDGSADATFSATGNEGANRIITNAIVNQVDWLQYYIETEASIDARSKQAYLLGVVDILAAMRNGWKNKEVRPTHFAQTIALYKKLINVNQEKQSLLPYVELFSYDIAHTATLPRIFQENASYKELENLLAIKYSQRYPAKTFAQLSKNPNVRSVDSIIKVVGRQYPEQLYSYAQSSNTLAYKIKAIKDDPFVKTVVSLSEMRSGQVYFPFLDNLVSGKLTIAQLDAAKDDRVKYFRLLVKTQLDYAQRAMSGDTAIGFKELTARLERKAKEDFVNEINALHDSPDATRFKCLEPLTAEELYFIAVLSDGLIYTSSYVTGTGTNGVFPKMMQKINNRGDSLLLSVKFDHYRKFISQAAAYNTLKRFFATFKNPQDAKSLMTTFVSGLEKSRGLEDGVDVADSYASLYETLPELAKEMLVNIRRNLDRNKATQNQNGIAIYNILYKLFLSADQSNNINLTKELGIPPVYTVPFNALANDKGEVITQMFFYGDDDGKMDFDIFVRNFSGNGWTVDQSNSKWVTVKSTTGAPVYIYANRPLPNEEDKDYVAQSELQSFLEEKGMKPTITFHRGHSYHANTTIDFMAPSSRIVFMGSCGGYNLIDSILKKSDDAHIISSKQVGYRNINLPFIQIMTERLRAKQNIDWLPFWKEFRTRANITGLEDYIPPYKNLGALFIKAYRKQTSDEEG